MKIYPVIRSITNRAKVLLVAGGLSFSPAASAPTTKVAADVFEKTSQSFIVKTVLPPVKFKDLVNMPPVPRFGSKDPVLLSFAPKSDTLIKGVKTNATMVVDVAHRVLFKYDTSGVAQSVYPIATGKPSTPTHTGLRTVSHIESYPYKSAPAHTKRRRNPAPYGKKCIILEKLDAVTGEKSSIGEFIHGNNDTTSIGKAVSHGCMRMDNDAVVELSSQVKRGDVVIIR
jgi:lipoprotein-anchoring transpeptidase ErfK/SrfK